MNDYIREAAGDEFTAKDFRTWTGTVLAAWALDELGGSDSPPKKQLVGRDRVGRRASSATRRPSAGRATSTRTSSMLTSTARSRPASAGRPSRTLTQGRHRLSPQEAAVLAFLERRLAKAD